MLYFTGTIVEDTPIWSEIQNNAEVYENECDAFLISCLFRIIYKKQFEVKPAFADELSCNFIISCNEDKLSIN